MKILVVGGVAGGASFAARMRRLDENAQIIIFERGEYVSFANCGLPYHLSGKIANREELILKTPADFLDNYNIEVKIKHEVLEINKEKKTVTVKNLQTKETIEESYDYLVLSPGAKAFIPPIDGYREDLVFTLKTIPDMDRIISHIKKNSPHKAIVIGGGFIGLEVVENLVERGIITGLVELADQILPPLDKEMTAPLHFELLKHEVSIYLKDFVKKIQKIGPTDIEVTLGSGKTIITQMIISAVGVRPESELAEKANLELNEKKAIKVNENMQTSNPFIYAIGDAIEVTHLINNIKTQLPLAAPAAKQARVVANHLTGLPNKLHRIQGTAILKLFSLTAATTGLSELALKKLNIPYQNITIHPLQHVGYYPGAKDLSIKVLFHKTTGEILGAQAVGEEGVDKRIDILATAIRAKMSIYELEDLELSYAPPYGSSKDPINMIGFIAQNIKNKLVTPIDMSELSSLKNPFYLDVRTPEEFAYGHIEGAINIPLYELRKKIDEIPRNRTIVINCAVGVRAYNASRILLANNYSSVFNLTGGYSSYLQFKK